MAKVLFVGDDWYGSNARSLAVGFAQSGADTIQISTTAVSRPRPLGPAWTAKKVTGARARWDVERVHAEIESAARSFRPDVMVCFKTVHLDQGRLLDVDVPIKLHYSADDVSNPANVTKAYLESERLWDGIITTKRHNVLELEKRGVTNPLFVFSAFDPGWHRPSPRTGSEQYDVGFVGNRRPDREQLIIDLGRIYGEKLWVAGPGWRFSRSLRATGARLTGPRYGEAFSDAVANMRANLVLLNSDNRDQHTCRSLEVPASAGLFVGERTAEHAELLEDGRECFLFGGQDELVEVLARVAADPASARAVADAGHRRVMSSGHTYRDRAEKILAWAAVRE